MTPYVVWGVGASNVCDVRDGTSLTQDEALGVLQSKGHTVADYVRASIAKTLAMPEGWCVRVVAFAPYFEAFCDRDPAVMGYLEVM